MVHLFIVMCMMGADGQSACETLKSRQSFQTLDQCVEYGTKKLDEAPKAEMEQNGVSIKEAYCEEELRDDQV